MAKTFHNTNKLQGSELTEAVKKAGSQEQIIEEIFKSHPEGLSASQVYKRFPDSNKNVPLTSIRRAISNKVFDGVLEFTGNMTIGLYGRPERIYKSCNPCKAFNNDSGFQTTINFSTDGKE